MKQHQEAWRKADDEDKKFLKRLEVSGEEIAKRVARAIPIDATDDDWEPQA